MFDRIAKIWNEVVSEDSTVNFTPAMRGAGRTQHYIHHDKTINPISKIVKPDAAKSTQRRGLPHILKPTKDSKRNSLWGSIGWKIGAGKNQELGEMKSYMTGMIRKRPREELVTTERPPEKTLPSLTQPRTLGELRIRAQNIEERANRFTQESPQYKRVRRMQRSDLKSSTSSNESFSNVIQRNRGSQRGLQPAHNIGSRGETQEVNFTNRPLKYSELPSSPFIPLKKPSQTVQSINEENGELNDSSQEKIKMLSTKVDLLETTVQSLQEELRLTSERSLQLEQSFRLSDKSLQTPIKYQESEPIDEGTLSPVKLDLNRFKIIR